MAQVLLVPSIMIRRGGTFYFKPVSLVKLQLRSFGSVWIKTDDKSERMKSFFLSSWFIILEIHIRHLKRQYKCIFCIK